MNLLINAFDEYKGKTNELRLLPSTQPPSLCRFYNKLRSKKDSSLVFSGNYAVSQLTELLGKYYSYQDKESSGWSPEF